MAHTTKPSEKSPILNDRYTRSLTYTKPNLVEFESSVPTIQSRSFTYHFYPKVVEPVIPGQFEQPPASSSSVFLMIFINFLSNVVFSIVLPTLPNFLDAVGSKAYYSGWAVAANSLGTFIASPLFGWWADKRTFREVFIISLVLMMLSNTWYALQKDMYQLFAARFVVGIAAANYAPANSYLSYATSPQERAKIMTWNAASTVLGFICGPAFSVLTSMPQLSFQYKITSDYTLDFNANTAPGWVSAFFSLFGMFCLIPFREVPKRLVNTVNNIPIAEKLRDASMRSVRSLSMISKSRIPLRGIMVCLFYTFSFTTAFTIFETTGPLYTSDSYGFKPWQNSLLFLVISVTSLIALAALQGVLYFVKEERILLLVFGILLSGGLIVLFDWNNGHASLGRFFGGIGMIAVAYSDGQALLLALFSKLLEEQEQGMMMGWLSSAGAISRMTCPIAASYVYASYGPNYIFLATAVLCFLASAAVLFGWKEIKPKSGKSQG